MQKSGIVEGGNWGTSVRKNKLSFTTRYVLLFGVLLFVASAALGLVVLDQSKAAMRELISKNMLDVVNLAAASLDGDALGALTEDDVDGPVFQNVKERLFVFQNSVDVHFIYAAKRVAEHQYVFTVDPDPVDPGEFGEPIVTTPALERAADGEPAVDSQPVADRWGNYYSAFSPVFDSSGNVAGVVGVDFDATWFDEQVERHTLSIATITSISVLLGVVVVSLINNRVRKRFNELNEGLSELSEDVDVLMDEVASYSEFDVGNTYANSSGQADAGDEMEVLGTKIRTMQSEMRLYLDYLRTQAYTDSLTHLGNTTAYRERVDELAGQIERGDASFWIVVFDINSLKELNDTYGHECGDYYIRGAAQAMQEAFGDESVYRIGGDEFAAIACDCERPYVEARIQVVLEAVDSFNAHTEYPARLSISYGVACFSAEGDASFTDVFERADEAMYTKKRAYYEENGGRAVRNVSRDE